MKSALICVAVLASLLIGSVAEAGPIQRAKQRGGKMLTKGKNAVGFVLGRLGGCG